MSKENFTIDHIKYVNENNDKKRFEIQEIDGVPMIRAVQGHSMKEV
jgi:RNA:NAD 2'-phosphotransferase (TPT1/KptA family)